MFPDFIYLNHLIDKHLTRRQANVVRLRYFEEWNFLQIGEKLGISRRQAERISEKSLKKLKKYVAKWRLVGACIYRGENTMN